MSTYSKDLSEKEALISAIKSCDYAGVRDVLNEVEHLPFTCSMIDGSPLHLICNLEKGELTGLDWESSEKQIIYMLVDAEFDIELVDNCGNTCLFYAVKNENVAACDVLLQCGADMWAQTECKVSVLEYVNQMSSSNIRGIFSKYSPGLWKSVENEDICQVRKLVNLWCRTDLHKNGITLKDIALGTGNEEIISLILGIFDSMKLVYHIYAKNIKAVRKLLETNRQRVRLDLRKMSDRGAPILYYLIQSKDIPAIELFIHHGCQLYTIMQDGGGCDMPVLFSALTEEVPLRVVEALLPPGKPLQEELLYKILYRGHTVLEVALEKNVNLEVFNVLINRGGPLLLCDRNQVNQTVKDMALSIGKTTYADAIDQVISNWILNVNEYPGRREKLALFGWDLETIKIELSDNACVAEYFDHFQLLQFQMEQLSELIKIGDIEMFLELKEALSTEVENVLWYGRCVGDGMPLLHKAVLYNRLKMVEIIMDGKPPKESIDNLFDQNRRTALHYAYSSASTQEIKKLLMSYGCSEHVLDKVNREPLDFRDEQDSPEMMDLLGRLKSKDLSLPEINPWSSGGDHKKCIPCEGPSDCESESLSEEEDSPVEKSCTII